ncbi:MAG TPA: hypothetical protein VJU77_01835 [Chthoniobacterales bacterium]|nr:hypothetical protein [Chthoniobacterales bacterium]
MLATIPDSFGFRFVKFLLILAATAALGSCASKEPPALVSDPSATHETSLPWNEQQKWEREGQGAMLNQQRR